jgi:hypothetical protein
MFSTILDHIQRVLHQKGVYKTQMNYQENENLLVLKNCLNHKIHSRSSELVQIKCMQCFVYYFRDNWSWNKCTSPSLLFIINKIIRKKVVISDGAAGSIY